jgi:hypothetical protein
MKYLIVLFLFAFMASAQAQQPVITQPYAVVSVNASGTIASTGVFQSIWTALTTNPNSPKRASCTVQNNGTHTMYVFFGPIASATTGTSVALAAGQAVNCSVGGTVLQDQVSITGTSTDAFFAAQQ